MKIENEIMPKTSAALQVAVTAAIASVPVMTWCTSSPDCFSDAITDSAMDLSSSTNNTFTPPLCPVVTGSPLFPLSLPNLG